MRTFLVRAGVLAPVLALALAACGDLDVRSIRPPEIAADVLAGEWVGSWHSPSRNTQGDVVVRVRQFDDQPVVEVVFDNPCIVSRSYELVVTASTIELRADGMAVLAATLSDERRLDGVFQCVDETGTWSAVWQRDLPPVLDLGGPWGGDVRLWGGPVHGLELDLQQSVRGGVVQLDGTLRVPGLWQEPIAVTGNAVFDAATFDVLLRSLEATGPQLVLTGTGDTVQLRVDLGFLRVFSQVPPLEGVFTLRRE